MNTQITGKLGRYWEESQPKIQRVLRKKLKRFVFLDDAGDVITGYNTIHEQTIGRIEMSETTWEFIPTKEEN